jgi:hypothetical protein
MAIGDSKFISVLLPTRKRTKSVEKSVRSLLDLATDPTRIQIAIAYDNDDFESHKYFTGSEWKAFIESYGAGHGVFECEPWGYEYLEKYYNLMAVHTSSDWLLVWNDDVVMLSQGWDQALWEIKDFIGMVHMDCNTKIRWPVPGSTLFPIVPRAWVDFFGCITGGPCLDSWIAEICHSAGTAKSINANVFHDRADVAGNNNDETYQDTKRLRVTNKKVYKSDVMKQLRDEWTQRWIKYSDENKNNHTKK